MNKSLFPGQTAIQARSRFMGQYIELKSLVTDAIGFDPLVIPAGESGCAILFPYGAVVTFGLPSIEEAAFLSYLQPFIQGVFEIPELETVELRGRTEGAERIDHDDILLIADFQLERLQLIAEILAKSVVLSHYEKRTAQSFDQIEPFAQSLQNTTWGKRETNALLRQLGNTLSIEHKIVGRVEIVDKPELLWENPELDRLYLRLEDEYEIRERHLALERKLGLVSRTAETAIELLQHNVSLRVEWYIVALIVIEIMLSIYELFIR